MQSRKPDMMTGELSLISIFLRACPRCLPTALAGLVVFRHAEWEITIEQVTTQNVPKIGWYVCETITCKKLAALKHVILWFFLGENIRKI